MFGVSECDVPSRRTAVPAVGKLGGADRRGASAPCHGRGTPLAYLIYAGTGNNASPCRVNPSNWRSQSPGPRKHSNTLTSAMWLVSPRIRQIDCIRTVGPFVSPDFRASKSVRVARSRGPHRDRRLTDIWCRARASSLAFVPFRTRVGRAHAIGPECPERRSPYPRRPPFRAPDRSRFLS